MDKVIAHGVAFCIATFILIAGCSDQKLASVVEEDSSVTALRTLTADEKEADFDQLLKLFKSYYGPYNFKEAHLGLSIEKELNLMKAKALSAKTDEEFAGYVMQFGALMEDGHVQIGIKNTSSGILRYKLPILVTPVEGKALIGDIPKELADHTSLSVGDEILAVDGLSPFQILDISTKYRNWAMAVSKPHGLVYVFQRPSYMTELLPTKPMVTIEALKADGKKVQIQLAWELDKYKPELDSLMSAGSLDYSVGFAKELNAQMDSHRLQMGQVNPVFLTPSVQKAFNFVQVQPSDDFRKKYGLADAEKPPIYAALYRLNGKTILLVRSATYSPSDFSTTVYMKAYMAIMDQYQDLADVLVLDQTHNPGGSYCSAFYNLFAKDGDVQTVQKSRADRKWINSFLFPVIPAGATVNPYEIKLNASFGRAIEKAYDAGDFLSEPLAFFTDSPYVTNYGYRWTKPMLVLVDELAGSCGDIFPMLVKANRRAKIFGQPSMGLGGNVEEVGVLQNSQISIRMTRGMFSPYQPNGIYAADVFIENNGVQPDYSYTHTVNDFRAGYVEYVKAFSEKALEQIPTP